MSRAGIKHLVSSSRATTYKLSRTFTRSCGPRAHEQSEVLVTLLLHSSSLHHSSGLCRHRLMLVLLAEEKEVLYTFSVRSESMPSMTCGLVKTTFSRTSG